MDNEELLEKDADFAQAWIAVSVVFEKVTAGNAQMSLSDGRWQSEGFFRRVESSKASCGIGEISTHVIKETVKAEIVHVELIGLIHGGLEAVGSSHTGVLAIIEGDIDRQPLWLCILGFVLLLYVFNLRGLIFRLFCLLLFLLLLFR